MPQAPPDDYPITGLCIVADPSQCPPGYEVILQTEDRKDDCDMWKDSFFRSRVTRYLCYTRIYPLDGGRLNNVLADITISNVGDMPPPGFSLMEKTVDTKEKAARKKQLCVKMLARNMCADAINSLVFLSKQKRPPNGYCLVGELNGLMLCFKIGPVPKETVTENNLNSAPRALPHPYQADRYDSWGYNIPPPPPTLPPQYSSQPAPSIPPTHAAPTLPPQQQHPQQHQQHQQQQARNYLTRQDSSLVPSNPMFGVPFRLNSCFQDAQSLHTNQSPVIHYRSAVDIDNEYNYSFNLECEAQNAPTSPSRQAGPSFFRPV